MSERILGVEGGGTKTSWVLVESEGGSFAIVDQGRLPPSNFRLVSPERLRSELRGRGFADFADFDAGGGSALLARKESRG